MYNFINPTIHTINWDEVEKLQEFQDLKTIGRHHEFHLEESAFEHTKMVCQALTESDMWQSLDTCARYLLLTAALFHDIGKGKTLKIEADDPFQDHHFPYHSSIGAQMTRFILWDKPLEWREKVCGLIRYHQKPFHIGYKKGDDLDRQIIIISRNSNVQLLYVLAYADKVGRTCLEQDGMDSLNAMRDRAMELDCWDKPFKFFNSYTKFKYFHSKDINPYSQIFDDTQFTVYVMCGISGSGKDCTIEHDERLNTLPIVSRDKIRIDLGFCKPGEKYKGDKYEESKVSEQSDKLIKDLCRKKQDFVVNNMNTSLRYRNELINTLIPYNPRIEFIYVETEKANYFKRREGQVNKDILLKMMRTMDMPQNSECYFDVEYNRN